MLCLHVELCFCILINIRVCICICLPPAAIPVSTAAVDDAGAAAYVHTNQDPHLQHPYLHFLHLYLQSSCFRRCSTLCRRGSSGPSPLIIRDEVPIPCAQLIHGTVLRTCYHCKFRVQSPCTSSALDTHTRIHGTDFPQQAHIVLSDAFSSARLCFVNPSYAFAHGDRKHAIAADIFPPTHAADLASKWRFRIIE